jgi:hypothetical protein
VPQQPSFTWWTQVISEFLCIWLCTAHVSMDNRKVFQLWCFARNREFDIQRDTWWRLCSLLHRS